MKTVFLDRDGVIIRKAREGEYIADWSEVEFLPGSLEAIGRLHREDFKVIVVTNQRGIATGKIKISNLEEIHARMSTVVSRNDGMISAIYYCPHQVEENCNCRKPKPGMLLFAAEAHRLNLTECWMVGDSLTDVEAGRRAGCRTALISSSFGASAPAPDICEKTLPMVVERILEAERGPNRKSTSKSSVMWMLKNVLMDPLAASNFLVSEIVPNNPAE
jgi:histidinol-phosphate phosphatase family protein